MVNSFLEVLLEGFFPNSCILCHALSRNPLPLCAGCRLDLAANSAACECCALPLPHSQSPICGHCLQSPPPFQRAIAPWLYSEHLAHLIGRWKFHHEQRLTALLADLWLQGAPENREIDLMVPMPLHWRRQWQRGYNQAELLARRLQAQDSRLSEVPLATRLLRRSRATAPQSGMDAQQRSHNLRGAFTVSRPCDSLRIAVVDDVLTTGATAAEAASALIAAGASHVEIWCVARTPAPQVPNSQERF